MQRNNSESFVEHVVAYKLLNLHVYFAGCCDGERSVAYDRGGTSSRSTAGGRMICCSEAHACNDSGGVGYSCQYQPVPLQVTRFVPARLPRRANDTVLAREETRCIVTSDDFILFYDDARRALRRDDGDD